MRVIVPIFVLLAAWALTLSGCGGGGDDPQEHFRAGQKLQEQGRFSESVAEYRQARRMCSQILEDGDLTRYAEVCSSMTEENVGGILEEIYTAFDQAGAAAVPDVVNRLQGRSKQELEALIARDERPKGRATAASRANAILAYTILGRDDEAQQAFDSEFFSPENSELAQAILRAIELLKSQR